MSYVKLSLSYIQLTTFSFTKLLPDASHRTSQKSPKLWVQNSAVTSTLAEITDCACQGCQAVTTTLSLPVFEHSSVTSLNSNICFSKEQLWAEARSINQKYPGVVQDTLLLCCNTGCWIHLRIFCLSKTNRCLSSSLVVFVRCFHLLIQALCKSEISTKAIITACLAWSH